MEFLAASILQSERNRKREQQRVQTMSFHKNIRDASDPFTSPDFHKTYRFTAEAALRIFQILKPYFPNRTRVGIPNELKFLAALHFFAQGSYQKSCCKDAGLMQSQSSLSRAITQTVNALNAPEVMGKWVHFPTHYNNRQTIIQNNFRQFGLPGVIGCVDGTHIYITPPYEHEELYVNRKFTHSINVQIACNSDLTILNVCAKYPGSSHDSFVWKSSMLREQMIIAHNENHCWMLGDSGYPTEPWMLTPILNATRNSPESNYTRLHVKARNSVERCFGVLKGHWRCIHKTRVLNYTPTKAAFITNACVVLHNIGVHERIGVPDAIEYDDLETILQQDDTSDLAERQIYNEGVRVRNDLVRRLMP